MYSEARNQRVAEGVADFYDKRLVALRNRTPASEADAKRGKALIQELTVQRDNDLQQLHVQRVRQLSLSASTPLDDPDSAPAMSVDSRAAVVSGSVGPRSEYGSDAYDYGDAASARSRGERGDSVAPSDSESSLFGAPVVPSTGRSGGSKVCVCVLCWHGACLWLGRTHRLTSHVAHVAGSRRGPVAD